MTGAWFAFSVDLEPNQDGTFDGVGDAMEWFDETVPRGTVFATYRIATERPEILRSLSSEHEIGVHVHPREFGHDQDQLAALERDRQCEAIEQTRSAVAEAAGRDVESVTSFRAGRHSVSEVTLDVLAELGFTVDASINVRYDDYLPAKLARITAPFGLDSGLLEVPTTWARPPLWSRVGLRVFPQRTVTATASTLRSDSLFCDGLDALRWLVSTAPGGVSMYMHPYDATTYHDDVTNSGDQFRRRVAALVDELPARTTFATVGELADRSDRDETDR